MGVSWPSALNCDPSRRGTHDTLNNPVSYLLQSRQHHPKRTLPEPRSQVNI